MIVEGGSKTMHCFCRSEIERPPFFSFAGKSVPRDKVVQVPALPHCPRQHSNRPLRLSIVFILYRVAREGPDQDDEGPSGHSRGVVCSLRREH